MIIIKSDSEIDLMRESGKVTGYILKELENVIKPGISTADVNHFVEKTIRGAGMIPTFLGYGGFPAAFCVSVNDEVVHGIPRPDHYIEEGDIVSLDACLLHKGYQADAARTYAIGKVSAEAQKLIRVAEESFFAGIEKAVAGNYLNDISAAIQKHVEANGFGVVRALVGHGIGAEMHEDPEVPNFARRRRGVRLKPGMTLAIEPMITAGDWDVGWMDDDWTVVTMDGSLAAHYENTILITDGEPEIFTLSGR